MTCTSEFLEIVCIFCVCFLSRSMLWCVLEMVKETVSIDFGARLFPINYISWSIFAYGFDFAEVFALAKKTLQCRWHRSVRLCNVIDTAESNSALSLTPLSQTLYCHWHRWVKLCIVINSTVFLWHRGARAIGRHDLW